PRPRGGRARARLGSAPPPRAPGGGTREEAGPPSPSPAHAKSPVRRPLRGRKRVDPERPRRPHPEPRADPGHPVLPGEEIADVRLEPRVAHRAGAAPQAERINIE